MIRSRTATSLLHSVQKYVSSLRGTTQDTGARSLEEWNQEFVDVIFKRGNCLLIYDSADQIDILEGILPQPSTKVHVLVTTRHRDRLLMKRGQVVELPPFEEDAAVEAFLGWAEITGKDTRPVSKSQLEAARNIVNDNQVKALPLAIRCIATYMKKMGLTCRELHGKLVEKERLRYLPEGLEEMLKDYGLQHLSKTLGEKDIDHP